MTALPTAEDLFAAVATIKASGASPNAKQAVFSPQPYPLFLADWNAGRPLAGRIVGWSVEPGAVPEPVVVFEDGGSTCLPLRTNMTLGMGSGGPMWIRSTLEEALTVAKAYKPPARRGKTR